MPEQFNCVSGLTAELGLKTLSLSTSPLQPKKVNKKKSARGIL